MGFTNFSVSGRGRVWGLLTLAVLLLSALAFTAQAGDDVAVRAVETGPHGSLWIVRGDRLQRFDGEERQSFTLPEAMTDSASLSLAVAVDSTLYLAGERARVYQSNDGGESWQKTDKGLAGDSINAVATHATLDNIVYANSPGQGMYRSEDSGASWARVDAGPQEPVQTFLHSNLPGSMETGWLFAGTERGVARSMDCFCFWSDAGDLRGQVTALAHDAEAPENVYAAVKDSLYHSTDGGESWSAMATPAPVIDLAVNDGQVYAGTAKGLFVLRDNEWFVLRDNEWDKAVE